MLVKCIYCQESKPVNSYKKAEHILPRSFGRFANNLTLNKIVCDDCNQHFGDKLEIALARDTFEGIQRFNFNVKKQTEFRSFGQGSRLVIRVTENPFKGVFAYREYSRRNKRIQLSPMAQVGFRRRGSKEYEYFMIDDIPDKNYLEECHFDIKHSEGIRAFGVEEEFLEKELAKRDIPFRKGGEIIAPRDSENLLCEIEGTIDKTIYRAVAKIAFNYLAMWQDQEFINHPSFDLTRRFIRYGERAPYPIVSTSEKPILADEPAEEQRTLGHIITVNWAADNVSILGQVSLFNWLTYSVCLARECSGERVLIEKGHFFNTNTHKILDLETK